jgi:hypothetical protein
VGLHIVNGEASRSAPSPSTKCMFSHKSGRFELSTSAPLGDTSATKPQEVVVVQYFSNAAKSLPALVRR